MKRHVFVTVVVMCHLLLVLCGAVSFSLLPSRSQGGQAQQLYGELSGANNGYWFFAPGVAPQVRVSFELKDAAGRTWTHEPSLGTNREELLRVSTILGSFRHKELGPAVGNAWAAQVLAQFPEAQVTVVRVDIREMPTMAEYAGGARPTWVNLRRITVVLDQQDNQNQ